jgi:hypothetical protein
MISTITCAWQGNGWSKMKDSQAQLMNKGCAVREWTACGENSTRGGRLADVW